MNNQDLVIKLVVIFMLLWSLPVRDLILIFSMLGDRDSSRALICLLPLYAPSTSPSTCARVAHTCRPLRHLVPARGRAAPLAQPAYEPAPGGATMPCHCSHEAAHTGC